MLQLLKKVLWWCFVFIVLWNLEMKKWKVWIKNNFINCVFNFYDELCFLKFVMWSKNEKC